MDLNALKKKRRLIDVFVSGDKKAQDILDFFKKKSKDADEMTRIRLAKALCDAWGNAGIPFDPPAVPLRNDYWYLVQLFFKDMHINKNNKPYSFDLKRPEEIIIDNFIERDFKKGPSKLPFLTKLLCQKANIKDPNDLLGREGIDKLIGMFGDLLLSELGISAKDFKISLIPYDIYLRLSSIIDLGKRKMNVFFDGYRLRPDDVVTGLFGGNLSFGGAPFIDSLWTKSVNYSIIPRLIIIRRNYGN